MLKESFLREHRTVFWNMVLYFKLMRVPLFMLDLDYSPLHVKVHVSQIKKYLPADKKLTSMASMNMRLDQDKLKRLESGSPIRKSSLGRVASSVVDAILGSRRSDAGGDSEEKKCKKHGVAQSYKSGNSGSVVTSLSDLERMERVMTQYANKSIVKYFGKQLEEFRREMQYAKEMLVSDLQSGIPEAMNKYLNEFANNRENPSLIKNFSEWSKQQQVVTAETIINSRQGSIVSSKSVITEGKSNAGGKGGGVVGMKPPLDQR